jgi:hypothetical protein
MKASLTIWTGILSVLEFVTAFNAVDLNAYVKQMWLWDGRITERVQNLPFCVKLSVPYFTVLADNSLP